MKENIIIHTHHVTKQDRMNLSFQKPCILWFTGFSGSGKSTIASALEKSLHENSNLTYLLDGDNVRHGLNKDLGFDDASRIENIRRIGEVSKLFVDSGLIVLSAFISPFIRERKLVKDLVEEAEFIEIFIDTPLEVCESRDPKGLYKKAVNGELQNFTGVNDIYEEPQHAEIIIDTDKLSVKEGTEQIIKYIKKRCVK